MIKDILKILENDARATTKQIATMTGTSSAEVAKLIEQAEEARTILKYKTVINWNKVGIVRDSSGLSEAIDDLVSLKRRLDRTRPESKAGLEGYLKVRSMLIASLAVANAAMRREESRGAHFREDFPTSDPAMRKAIHVALDRGGRKARAPWPTR